MNNNTLTRLEVSEELETHSLTLEDFQEKYGDHLFYLEEDIDSFLIALGIP